MGVKLDVPLVKQSTRSSCWYASVCMIAYYHEIGPRLGLPERWIGHTGLNSNNFIDLAKVEGLLPIQCPVCDITEQHLEVFLRNYGPIWCSGNWDSLPHAVVLTGVGNGKVYINDPCPCKGKRVESLIWFNQKLYNMKDCMLYKPH